MSKMGTPRPSGEVLAEPDHTLESLSLLHPAERRVILARTEAACLSNPSGVKSGKGHYQPSSWLRGLVAQYGDEVKMGGSLASIKARQAEAMDEDD